MRLVSTILQFRQLPAVLRRSVHCSKITQTNVKFPEPQGECEEIKIKLPCGEIAGKWWGPQNVRPIIGLHGWQDNAGTFDRLAPLLPKHIGFLAIDLPGHGFSSRNPDGMFYNVLDILHLVNLIKTEYNWDKISMINHSMSSILGFFYCSLYPEHVDMFIGFDALKPYVRDSKKQIPILRKRLDNFLVADLRNQTKMEPPSYSYEEMVQRMLGGTYGSITEQSCHYLLARAITKSTKYPGKYFFHRDNRVKYGNYVTIPQEMSIEMAKRINMPYQLIKFSESAYFEDKKYFTEIVDLMKENNDKFEFHEVKGQHHEHLNNPESFSDIICDFICKYRPPETASNKL